MIWKILLTHLYTSSKYWHISLYNIKKLHLWILPLISSEYSIKYGGAVKFPVAKTSFPNFYFFLENSTVIFLKVTGSLYSFPKKMSAKCPSLNNHSSSVILSSGNCFHERKYGEYNSTKIITLVLFLETAIVLQYVTKLL